MDHIAFHAASLGCSNQELPPECLDFMLNISNSWYSVQAQSAKPRYELDLYVVSRDSELKWCTYALLK